MPRYIDADALMKDFASFVRRSNNSDFAKEPNWNDAVSIVENAPTADVVKRKKGEWILDVERGWDGTRWRKECSECSYEPDDNSKNMNFCPCCGADMRDMDAWISLPELKEIGVNVEEPGLHERMMRG